MACVVVDAPFGEVVAGLAFAGEGVVGAGEDVDAVVVPCVGEGRDFIEEGGAVGAADGFDQAVFGGGGDDLGADLFGAARSDCANGVAAENFALVMLGEQGAE